MHSLRMVNDDGPEVYFAGRGRGGCGGDVVLAGWSGIPSGTGRSSACRAPCHPQSDVARMASGPVPILIALRLKLLLSVHDIHLSTWETIKLVFGANFLISALPAGTSGGHAAKRLNVASRTPHKHEAVTTVFFDRVMAWPAWRCCRARWRCSTGAIPPWRSGAR